MIWEEFRPTVSAITQSPYKALTSPWRSVDLAQGHNGSAAREFQSRAPADTYLSIGKLFGRGVRLVSEDVRGIGRGDVASEPSKAEHYLTRAEELRVLAESMTSIEARGLLLEIAQHYVRLAAALVKFGANEIS